jgi:Zn-dependent M32 family carboxypeptidase
MSAMSDLLAYQRQTEALSQVMGRLGWDQETVMPPGAANPAGRGDGGAGGGAACAPLRPVRGGR